MTREFHRLQPDAPQSEHGQTRRARRAETATPVASSATADAGTRAARRRETAGIIAASPVVWGALRAQAAAAAQDDAPAPAADVAPLNAPTTRALTRRELRTTAVAIQPEPVVLDVVPEPHAAAEPELVDEPAVAEAAEMQAEPAEPELVPEAVLVPEVAAEPESILIPEVDLAAESEPDEDAFEIAARLFSFTGETPIIAPAAAEDDEDAEPAASGVVSTTIPTASARPPRRIRRRAARAPRPASTTSPVRRLAAASFTIGVMGAVGMLTVATAAPAEAVAAAVKTEPVTSIQAPAEDAAETGGIQAYVAPENVDIDLGRESDTYTMATFSEIAAATGITRHTNFFVNDPNGEIQWPFAVGVPISDGYGPRWGGMHWGLDFTPGEGAEIQAVAAGTVRIANESGGAFGVHVMIDHEINGEVFSTHYAHMLYGSLQVQAGDKVEAGTVLGHVGDTGLSYGAHLHFEVFVANQRIDPLTWLREHAGG